MVDTLVLEIANLSVEALLGVLGNWEQMGKNNGEQGAWG